MTRNPRQDVHIVALGAVTPVGGCWVSSAAGVRAGVSRLHTFSTRIDGRTHPFIGASLAPLDDKQPRHDLLRVSLRAALEEAASMLPAAHHALPVLASMFLSLSCSAGFDASFEVNWLESCELDQWQWIGCDEIPMNDGSALFSISQAIDALDGGQCELAVVAGAQSLFESATLNALAGRNELYSEDNPFGVPPGEAACVCCLSTEKTMSQRHWQSLARVIGVGTSNAPKELRRPEGANALYAAINDALRPVAPDASVFMHVNNMDAERWRAEEFGLVAVRLRERLTDPTRFIAPATAWGNVGTATGGLLIQQAIAHGQRGMPGDSPVLIWTSSKRVSAPPSRST